MQASLGHLFFWYPCCKRADRVDKNWRYKRPDGNTLVPWSAGKCVIWDFTIADTMASSYAAISSVSAGLIAEQSSARKLSKYSELAINHIFVPIAMESFGPICAEALTFLSELGRRISVVTGDMRETTFLFQRLSIAIQRFTCVLFKSYLKVLLY